MEGTVTLQGQRDFESSMKTLLNFAMRSLPSSHGAPRLAPGVLTVTARESVLILLNNINNVDQWLLMLIDVSQC